MSTRLSKYYQDEEVVTNSRYHKNEELYKEISKSELENYEVKSNSTVLGENKNEIDVEKIKEILDTKYNNPVQRRSIRIAEEEEIEEKQVDDTKEYDINVVLEKAREQKTENYDEERLKKLRDTQFDILKNLNINKEKELEDENEENDNLTNLINTIALNESKSSKEEALDILSDLKGSDNTEVLDGLKEEINENILEDKKEKEEKKEEHKITDTEMINSFYTSSNALKDKDFEDVDDFSKDVNSNNIFIKVIIAIIVVVFIAGAILLIKTIFFT